MDNARNIGPLQVVIIYHGYYCLGWFEYWVNDKLRLNDYSNMNNDYYLLMQLLQS